MDVFFKICDTNFVYHLLQDAEGNFYSDKTRDKIVSDMLEYFETRLTEKIAKCLKKIDTSKFKGENFDKFFIIKVDCL